MKTAALPPSGKVIGTHSGNFHADEALGCFMLRQLPEYAGARIVRSRDEMELAKCDILIDVGAIYDPSASKFDHHQAGFFETADGTIGVATKPEEATGRWTTKLSSAGLVYKHFGRKVIMQLADVSEEGAEAIWAELYDTFIEATDAIDNGIEINFKDGSNLASRVGRLNSRWNEVSRPEDEDARFERASALTGEDFLGALAELAESWLPARALVADAVVRRHDVHPSGEIVSFTSHGLPWKTHLYVLEREANVSVLVKFVLYMDRSTQWRVQAVTEEGALFTNRLSLLKPWCGLRGKELSEVAGIEGCIFVHANGFIGSNATYEGALAMAVKCLEHAAAAAAAPAQEKDATAEPIG